MSQQITQWKGIDILSRHMLDPAIEEIASHQKSLDLTSIGIIGREGTGKSTLAQCIAHLVHRRLDEIGAMKSENEDLSRNLTQIGKGYLVRVFDSDHDLSNFRQIVEDLPPVNRIIIFDDASFIQSNMRMIKHEVSKIRHLEGGVDVKTILVFNFHYTKGLDIYLRDCQFNFCTYVHGIDAESLKERFGALAGGGKIASYLEAWKTFSSRGKLDFQVTEGEASEAYDLHGNPVSAQQETRTVTYRWGDPGRLALFFGGERARVVLYPKPQFFQSYHNCAVCSNAAAGVADAAPVLDVGEVVAFGTEYFKAFSKALRHRYRALHGRDPIDSKFGAALAYVQAMEEMGVSVDDMISKVDLFKPGDLDKKRRVLVPLKTRYAFESKFGYDVLAQGRGVDPQMQAFRDENTQVDGADSGI